MSRVVALEAVALAGYAAFLATAFGWRTVDTKRRIGESAWRKPVSATDAFGETLCALGCVVTLVSPLLALVEVVVPEALGGAGLRLGVTVASVTVATGLALWSQHHLAAEWRAGIEPSSRLVTTGPFARVRNPFYLACLLASFGVAVAVPSSASVFGILLHVVAAEVIVRGVEEPVLARAHGDEFQRYRLQTPRFRPSLRRTSRNSTS